MQQGVTELKRERDALMTITNQMPSDLRESLSSLDADFSRLYKERDEAIAIAAEEKARRDAQEKQEREAKRQIEEEASKREQALGMTYTNYMYLSYCVQEFTQFNRDKEQAKSLAKKLEQGIATEKTKAIWDRASIAYQKMEPLLRMSDNLYRECLGARQALATVQLNEGLSGKQGDPTPFKKDF